VTISRGTLSRLLLFAVLAADVTMTGCAERHHRVYDPYYNDYHHWDNNEIVFNNQWVIETHRDPHRQYRKLNRDEQRQYWEWRHHHGDHH
jgi:hypothetical protein